jgi:hypothetical protein
MNTRLLRPALFLIASSVLATGLFAQTPAAPKLDFPAASPAGTIKQRVGLTDIEVEYSRPGMKGRVIYGGLVPYGAVWRTGANTATKITFSTPVKFGGADVPAGSYALYTIPGKKEWTVIINKVTGQWGSYQYDEKNDLVRAKVKPVALPTPVETFSIGLGDLRDQSATLYLVWETTRVPVKLEFDTVGILVPQIEAAMAADGKKPYFPAAMFYYENNLDLKKAAAWIDAAATEQPDAFWLIYRKGLIHAKMGDKAGAIAAAKQSLELAAKQNGEIKEEYTRLNKALLARLK